MVLARAKLDVCIVYLPEARLIDPYMYRVKVIITLFRPFVIPSPLTLPCKEGHP